MTGSDLLHQCANCGTNNRETAGRCSSCNRRLRKSAFASPSPTAPGINRYAHFSVPDELAPGPRRVPSFLLLVALGPILPGIVFALAGTAILFNDLGVSLVAIAGILAVAIFGFLRALRRRALLAHGVLCRAEVLACETGMWSHSSSHISSYQGWEKTPLTYSGPIYKERLRLWSPNGDSVTFKKRGLKYTGEYYLVHPTKPRLNMRVYALGVPLKPKDGHWKVWPAAQKRYLALLTISVVVPFLLLGYLTYEAWEYGVSPAQIQRGMK